MIPQFWIYFSLLKENLMSEIIKLKIAFKNFFQIKDSFETRMIIFIKYQL